MSMQQDLKEQIYDLDATLDSALRLMQADKRLSQANKQNIVELVEDGKSRGLSKNRLIIYIYHLRRLAALTKADFRAFTTEDAKQLMKALEASKYGDWTKVTCKKLFKMLMRQYGRPADVYSWIKAGHPPVSLKKEDLLTPDEVRKIIAAAPSNMWKALISILAESGCRPGEALNLTVGSVIVNSDHIKLYVRGKMAKSGDRPLFLFKTYDTLNTWLVEHPHKKRQDAHLWVGKRGEPVSLHTLNTTFRRLARNAGISRRVFPYLLRHCFATEAYLKYQPHLAQKMLGHNDMRTSRVYVHMNEDDVLEALQQENGIKIKKAAEEANPELCRHCGHQNPYGSIQCNSCKAGLGAAGAIKIEQENEEEAKAIKELKELLADPQIINLLQKLKDPTILSNLEQVVKKGQ